MRRLETADDDYRLWIMFNQTNRATLKAREKELTKLGLSRMESFILFVIRSMGEEATPAEIARVILRQPHTVSEMLSRMEKKDLISKSRNPKNRSMIRLKLTKKGQSVYRKTRRREVIHRIFADLTVDERNSFMLCLESIRAQALREVGIERTAFFPSIEEL